MKRNYTRDDMNRFLNEMGDRLAADNLFVYGISNIREFRDIHLDGKGREMSNKFSLMAFMLVNVFSALSVRSGSVRRTAGERSA